MAPTQINTSKYHFIMPFLCNFLAIPHMNEIDRGHNKDTLDLVINDGARILSQGGPKIFFNQNYIYMYIYN